MLKQSLFTLAITAGFLTVGAVGYSAQAQSTGDNYGVHDVCGVTPKTGSAYKDAYQIDVFEEDGVYSFCGKLQREKATVTFSPVLKLAKTTSWADYECLVDGKPYYPARYKARCLFGNAEVSANTHCKREGDKEGTGYLSGLRSKVPVSLPMSLGYVIVQDSAGKVAFVTSSAEPDTSAAKPVGYGDFGNVVVREGLSPTGVVVRSYAHDTHFAEADKTDYKLVVQKGHQDLLRNYFVSSEDFRGAGQTIKIGACTRG